MQPPEALYVLQRALRQRKANAAALALLRRTQQVYPQDFWVNHELGMALVAIQPPQYEEAIRYLTAAVALRPDSPAVHVNLGLALTSKGRLDEGAAAVQKAIALEPGYAVAHSNLGQILLAEGRLDEAIASYRRAIELNPDWSVPHRLLGDGLSHKGQFSDAAVAYQRAIELKADYAEAHCHLGRALRQQGELVQALAAYKLGHAIGSQRPTWSNPSAKWIWECQRLIELEGQLAEILRGERKPANADETFEFALLCFLKQYYLAAVRFYADALANDPSNAADEKPGKRGGPICAAVLAAAGQGRDARKLGSKERSHWRKQALQWLRTDLAAYNRLLSDPKNEDHPLVRRELGIWRCEQWLASVRDPAALSQLPEDEQLEHRQFWAEVESTLKKTIPGP
jgi:tetratricopeptide (TPR) repeat protein